jgi:undecaprenyl-diphosphatase
MEFLLSAILGIIQGILEFLPVSSSGHLAAIEQLIRLPYDMSFFNVCIHIGTLLAILIALQKDIARLLAESLLMLRDVFHNLFVFIRSARKHEEPKLRKIITSNYRRLAMLIAGGAIPTAIIGFFLRSIAKTTFGSLLYTGIGMLMSGIVLIVVGQLNPGNKIPKDITAPKGLLAGIAQGFTVLSGVSHSAIMLSSGILLGFNKRLAIRYAYLMSIPCIIGAVIVEALSLDKALVTPDYMGMCAIGTLCSLIIGVLFIQRLLRYIRTRSFTQFAYYNFLIGAVVIALHFALRIS